MSKIQEAQTKLKFADYLLSKGEDYSTAAATHILKAANLIVSEHLNITDNIKLSPQLVNNQLEKGTEEEKEFSNFFLPLWQMTVRKVGKEEVLNAYKKVNAFLTWVIIQKEAKI